MPFSGDCSAGANRAKGQAHSSLPECDSREVVQTQASDSNRVVSATGSVGSSMFSMVYTSGGSVCH